MRYLVNLSSGKNDFLQMGYNEDVCNCVLKCFNHWCEQTRILMDEELFMRDILTKLRSCWNYFNNRVRYVEDKVGYQYIKSPYRLLDDGYGDCKSFTLFFASCLHVLGIRGIIRFVNFDGGDQFTHVYCIAYDERGNEIILDAVEKDKNGQPIFDYARDYALAKDYDIK